jgi:hypothetical protein
MVQPLVMPPSQYETLMGAIEKLGKEMRDRNKELHDHTSSLESRLDHALYGGNGDGPGIFERFRNIFDWRAEHLKTHDHIHEERRDSTHDWRKFWIGVADRTFTVLFAVIAALIMYMVTGHALVCP